MSCKNNKIHKNQHKKKKHKEESDFCNFVHNALVKHVLKNISETFSEL